MKLQSILLLTGIAAGLMTVSCQSSTQAEAEAFFGPPPKGKAAIEAEDDAANADFYTQVNRHIDRRLNEFNEKEEAKLPVFSSKEAKEDFQEFSFIKNAAQISSLSLEFSASENRTLSLFFDRDSRTFTRTFGDKTEEYTFETFTNGVPPAIPYDAHILYAFASNFNRIAETVTVRGYEKLERGENPAIADLHNESNIDEKGKKKDKNFVEIKPKVTFEPIEYRVDNRWCKCYDVKLKSVCAPAVSMALYVSSEEKTISRADVIFDDDSKITLTFDWREQNGIVLPRVVRFLGKDSTDVFFREDAKVILIGEREAAEAEAAAEAGEAAMQAAAEAAAESETVEFDASAGNAEEEAAEVEDAAEEEDILEEEDASEDEEDAAEDDASEEEEDLEEEDSAEEEEDLDLDEA